MALAGFGNRFREDGGAAVLQVVAIDRRDDDVVQLELLDRVGHPLGLLRVHRSWASVRHRAVGAGACADVAQDHEGRGPVIPALADVRASRFLAHGVQVEVAHDRLESQVARRPGRPDFQPVGFRQPGLLRGREGDHAGHSLNYIGSSRVHTNTPPRRTPRTPTTAVFMFDVHRPAF